MKQLLFLLVLLMMSSNLFAQSKRFKIYKENSRERVKIYNKRPLSLFYEKASWNQNPTLVESGYIFISDKESGEILELKLTETEPNSAVFNIDLPPGKLNTDSIKAEMYSAPQSMLTGENHTQIIKGLLAKKAIKRKPFLLRALRRKGQIVDVFDSKKMALSAYAKYKQQLGLNSLESDSIIEVKNHEEAQAKKIIDTSTLQSLFLANESNLNATNEKNKELREVLIKVEKERREKVKTIGRAWSFGQRNTKAAEARKLIATATKQLKNKEHNESMGNFYKASDLAPGSEDTYEQYGVSLFRVEKFNQSIVVLELANSSKKRAAEKEFYLGMSYYKLKDYENAIAHFSKVMEVKDKMFSATAAFYKGTALIEMREYDKSKAAFQYVLDNSTNPDMDTRAEKFIEYSIEQKALDKKRSNRFSINGALGFMYDSNIILATDAARTQGGPQGEGWRFLLQSSFKYRPYYAERNEISIAADIMALQSVDSSFAQTDNLTQADPYVVGLRLPWTHRGTLSGKGYFFTLSPSYEAVFMDLDLKGKKVMLRSTGIDFDNTVVINKNWVAKLDFNLADNNASTQGPGTVDETTADATSYGLRFSSILILDKDQERYLIPEVGYSVNDAKGKNFAFSRIDIAASLTTSLFDTFIWNNRLGYYLANYENTRVDNNYSFASGLSYHINTNWDWGLTASYALNDSTTNRYDKLSVLTTFAFSY